MNRRYRLPALMTLTLLVLSLAAVAPAQEVWSGYGFSFEKENYADWTMEENQDRITDTVWITRADNQGIFNIAQEDGYQHNTSPVGTEWATGRAEDWETLSFSDWESWHDSYPSDVIGVEACVHLIEADIYIDIRFDSWQSGGLGGGFSYVRGTPTVGTSDLSWDQIKALYR